MTRRSYHRFALPEVNVDSRFHARCYGSRERLCAFGSLLTRSAPQNALWHFSRCDDTHATRAVFSSSTAGFPGDDHPASFPPFPTIIDFTGSETIPRSVRNMLKALITLPLLMRCLHSWKEVGKQCQRCVRSFQNTWSRLLLSSCSLPLTPSGKLNWRLLRNTASELEDKLQRYYVLSTNIHPRRQARTQQESTIQQICTRILRVDSTDIDMNGSFLENGGNSITAMQLVSETREAGFFFTTRDVFRQLSLAELAGMVESPKGSDKDDGPAVGDAWTAALKSKLERQPSSFSSENISDVFPCTETQQWMLNNGEGGDFLLRFSGPLDTSRLQSACQRLVKIHTALRCFSTPMRLCFKLY